MVNKWCSKKQENLSAPAIKNKRDYHQVKKIDLLFSLFRGFLLNKFLVVVWGRKCETNKDSLSTLVLLCTSIFLFVCRLWNGTDRVCHAGQIICLDGLCNCLLAGSGALPDGAKNDWTCLWSFYGTNRINFRSIHCRSYGKPQKRSKRGHYIFLEKKK